MKKINEDKVQKALDKYEKKFHAFMLQMSDQVTSDKAFKDLKGNVFAALCVSMKKNINGYLRYAGK